MRHITLKKKKERENRNGSGLKALRSFKGKDNIQRTLQKGKDNGRRTLQKT